MARADNDDCAFTHRDSPTAWAQEPPMSLYPSTDVGLLSYAGNGARVRPRRWSGHLASRLLLAQGAPRRWSGRDDPQRQGIEPAQRVVEPPLRLGRQLERGDALGERAEDRLGLKPRHRLTYAAVNAGAEGHVTGRPPPNVELIGPLPAARVAIGGGKEQQ